MTAATPIIAPPRTSRAVGLRSLAAVDGDPASPDSADSAASAGPADPVTAAGGTCAAGSGGEEGGCTRSTLAGPSREPLAVDVIFDLDGTVWDSLPGILGSLEYTFVAFDMETPPRERLAEDIGPPLQVMLGILGFPEDRIDEAASTYRERYVEWGAYRASLYPGVVDQIMQLRGEGHRLATATSKGVGPTEQMLDHFGISELFEVVGAASMDTSAITKEAVLERTLDALGRPDPGTCVMFGDRRYDVTGAASFGIDAVGVLWGYGDERELTDAGAWRIISSADEIAGCVAAHRPG